MKGTADDEHNAEGKEAIDNAQKTARAQGEEQHDSSNLMKGIVI